ncbi:hypothetical protein [Methylomonas albis]|uniref:Uncharacterized protein n=1 Tax=Methylomonas albis TaxID=1854563 RepID=A0ABR9D2V9_9GAMM|nr:hypothetical protein [Methylomonas albis]MBD9357141.1 hypothetical protein [Methylomonas albis]
MSSPRFKATRSDGTDATSELLSFAEAIGLESVVAGRYSFLLLLELFGATRSGMLNPAKVVNQIRVLEGVEVAKGLKAATPFKYPPLQGLWHQHYLEDGLPSMTHNIQRGIDKFGLPWFKQKIADAEASGEEWYVTEADVAHIAHDAIASNWERLINKKALTGEWLIFAKHEGKNYYLSLGKHNSGDDLLRSQIDAICLQEFPFLKNILDAQSSQLSP